MRSGAQISLLLHRVDLAIAAFVVFSLHYFGYQYLYHFHEGVSDAPFIVKAMKDVLYFVLLGTIIFALPWRLAANRDQLIFIPLAATLCLVSFIHASHTSLAEQVWQNVKNVVLFIPIYMVAFSIEDRQRQALCRWLFWIFLFVAVTQISFSFAADYFYFALWDGRLYAGLVGNPNSFSLVLNLAAAVVLGWTCRTNRVGQILGLILFGAITFAILKSTSGSQYGLLAVLLIYSAVFNYRHWRTYILMVATMLSVSMLNQWNLGQTVYTVASGLQLLQGDPPPEMTDAQNGVPGQDQKSPADAAKDQETQGPPSASVTNRLENIRLAVSVFRGGWGTTLLGSFDSTSFVPMDGQFWVFLFNGGLLTLLALAVPAGYVYVKSAVHAFGGQDSTTLILHLMIVAFGITFLASRVLMYFPLNFLFFLISGLALARIKAPNRERAVAGTEQRVRTDFVGFKT